MRMPLFEHTATFPFSRETVWNWHARPGAVRRIMPDWEGIRPWKSEELPMVQSLNSE